MDNRHLRKFIRDFLPPIFTRFLERKLIDGGYFGDYSSWEEARCHADGYGAKVILDRVRASLSLVRDGNAVFERDSVLFDEVQYSWPLIAGLLWIASCNGNQLTIADFGGSLGSSYYQNIRFLSHLEKFRWGIIEQPAFVECGLKEFANKNLAFYESLESCVAAEHPDTLLLLSVLQFLENPYELLQKVIEANFKFIIIDRTPFVEKRKERIVVQKVPPEIYPASYPARFLNIDSFRATMNEAYEEVAIFSTGDHANIEAIFRGFIFKRRST